MIILTDFEKEFAKQMYDKYMNEGMVDSAMILDDFAEKYGIFVNTKGDEKDKEYKAFIHFKWDEKDHAKTRRTISELFSLAILFDKLEKGNYLHLFKDFSNSRIIGTGKYLDNKYSNCDFIEFEKDGTKKNYDKVDNCFDGYNEEDFTINKFFYDFINSNRQLVICSEFLHYIENDFKTDEEIRFDKQLEQMKEELNEAKRANERANKDTQEQLKLTQDALNVSKDANKISSEALKKARNSNWIALAAVVVSAVFNILAACIHSTMDEDQFKQLRQSIESTKSVKVENDTFAINAKVDTVTVKQAVKPVMKKKQNK